MSESTPMLYIPNQQNDCHCAKQLQMQSQILPTRPSSQSVTNQPLLSSKRHSASYNLLPSTSFYNPCYDKLLTAKIETGGKFPTSFKELYQNSVNDPSKNEGSWKHYYSTNNNVNQLKVQKVSIITYMAQCSDIYQT